MWSSVPPRRGAYGAQRPGEDLTEGSPTGAGFLTEVCRAGLGGVLGDPGAHLSWISLDEVARVYVRTALGPTLSGPVNAVAPEPVTQREYAATLAGLCRRPAWLPVPRLGPRLLLGRDGAEELAFADQRVFPTRLAGVGFEFEQPHLAQALAESTGLSWRDPTCMFPGLVLDHIWDWG